MMKVTQLGLLYVFTLLASSAWAARVSIPSCRELRMIKHELNNIYRNTFFHARTLRLAFHDCVNVCDGCLNLDNQDNVGLAEIIGYLELVYASLHVDRIMSRADYWAMASLFALEKAMDNARIHANCGEECSVPEVCFNYKWGRTDCPTSPMNDETTHFPEPLMSADAMFQFFNKTFGFNKQQMVAIMGAHQIGGAFLAHSGYTGVWSPTTANDLSNNLFATILHPEIWWEYVNVGSEEDPRWQFHGHHDSFQDARFKVSMMFNTDFQLFFNLTTDENGKVTCRLDTQCGKTNTCGQNNVCPKSDTYDISAFYAENNDAFVRDFKKVMEIMLDHGYEKDDLIPYGDTCSCSYF